MSETTNAATTASKKAAAAVAETLPTVVATTHLDLEVPAKVVLNQKLVVATSALAGAGVMYGVMFGWKKFQERRAAKALTVPDTIETVSTEK
jgi:hypothetical protein